MEALRKVLAALFAIGARVEVRGLETLPPADSGGFIMIANHNSRFDTPLVFSTLRGYRLTGLAGDTYRSHTFFRWFLETTDIVWLNRGATGPSAIKAAVQALRAGRVLGIAPEGKRSTTGGLIEGRTGVAFIARAAQARIVPVGVIGSERLADSLRRLRRAPLTIVFGRPFTLPPREPGRRAEQLAEDTAEIMCRLAAILPPRYRGVYADHPRLAAILAESQPE